MRGKKEGVVATFGRRAKAFERNYLRSWTVNCIFLVKRIHLESDRTLARLIDISPATLSKIRNRNLPVGASFLIARMKRVTSP